MSVPQEEDFATLYITNTVLGGAYNSIYVNGMGGDFTGTSNNYNGLMIGETVHVYYYDGQNGTVLKSLVINGKSYTTTSAGVEIEVTGDMYVEAVFSSYGNENTVTFTEVDTTKGAGAHEVDPYVSYTYLNGQTTNVENRLYAGSTLEINLQNANIVGVTFVFEDPVNYAPNKEDKLNTNVIKLGSNELEYEIKYKSSGELLVATVELKNLPSGQTTLQYKANVQARVVSILVTYAAYNQPLAN